MPFRWTFQIDLKEAPRTWGLDFREGHPVSLFSLPGRIGSLLARFHVESDGLVNQGEECDMCTWVVDHGPPRAPTKIFI